MKIKELTIETLKSIISNSLIESGKSSEEIAKLTKLSCNEIKSYVEKTSMPNLQKYLIIANALGIDAKKTLDLKTYVDNT